MNENTKTILAIDTHLSNIREVNDSIFYEKSNYVHFISSDGQITTDVGKSLVRRGLINPEYLKAQNLNLGEIVISRNGGYKVFSIALKEKASDKIFLSNLTDCFLNLYDLMEHLEVTKLRFARVGDGLEKIPYTTLERVLRLVFNDPKFQIVVCQNLVVVPEVDDRKDIISEAHDSAVGGHKGVIKTYHRVRELFKWNGMKEEIAEYINAVKAVKKRNWFELRHDNQW